MVKNHTESPLLQDCDYKRGPKVMQSMVRQLTQKLTNKKAYSAILKAQNGIQKKLKNLRHSTGKLCPSYLKSSCFQDGTEMTKYGPKMAQDRPKIAQDGPKMTQDGPKPTQDGPKCSQEGPKMRLDGPKMHHPNMIQDGSSMVPNASKIPVSIRGALRPLRAL